MSKDVIMIPYFQKLSAALESYLPPFKMFCLAARRRSLHSLAAFIGERLYWLEVVCLRPRGRVVEVIEERLDGIENLGQHPAFRKQIKRLLWLDRRLKDVRNAYGHMNRLWL